MRAGHGSDRPCGVPVHVLAGELRRARGDTAQPRAAGPRAGAGSDRGPLGLVVLDSTVPGESSGELDQPQLARGSSKPFPSSRTGDDDRDEPSPPASSSPAWDTIADLSGAVREALADVRQAVPAGTPDRGSHIHRTTWARSQVSPVLVAPGTYLETRLAYAGRKAEFFDEPAGFAVHAAVGDAIASEVHAFAV